jgi:hypothetical protein
MNESAETLRVREFHQRHGPEFYCDNGWVYYADGSMREFSLYGALVDPPNARTVEGEFMLAENRLKFASLKLQAAVNEFDELNERLSVANPANPAAEIEKLKHLQQLVTERQRIKADAETALENTHLGQKRAQRRQRWQEEEQRRLEFQQARRAIRI